MKIFLLFMFLLLLFCIPYQSEAHTAWNRMQEQKSMNTLRGLSQSAVKLLKGYKINRICWTTNWTKMHYIQCSNGKLWNGYRYGKRIIHYYCIIAYNTLFPITIINNLINPRSTYSLAFNVTLQTLNISPKTMSFLTEMHLF